jgi:hypothetical protein
VIDTVLRVVSVPIAIVGSDDDVFLFLFFLGSFSRNDGRSLCRCSRDERDSGEDGEAEPRAQVAVKVHSFLAD